MFVWRARLKSVLAWAEKEKKQDLYLSTAIFTPVNKSCFNFTVCFSLFHSCCLLDVEYHEPDSTLLSDIITLFCFAMVLVFNAVIRALRVFFWLQIIAWICFRKPHSSTIYRSKPFICSTCMWLYVQINHWQDLHHYWQTNTQLTKTSWQNVLLTLSYENVISECLVHVENTIVITLWEPYI